MKKGLLLCSGGMSTTMIAKELNKIFDGEMKWDAKGVAGSSEYADTLDEYSFVFVSPQIRFLFEDIAKETEALNIPVAQIQPTQYIVTKAGELADIVREALK